MLEDTLKKISNRDTLFNNFGIFLFSLCLFADLIFFLKEQSELIDIGTKFSLFLINEMYNQE